MRRGFQDLFEQDIDGSHYTSIGGEVDPALLVGFLFPPPPSRSFGLAGRDRSSAGIASDACVSAGVEWMSWDVVPADVLGDLFGGPIGEGADFHWDSV